MAAIDVEIGSRVVRPLNFDAQEMARAGVFVSIEVDGSLCIERGYVRPEDEPVIESEDSQADAVCAVAAASAGVEGDMLSGTTDTHTLPIVTPSRRAVDEDGKESRYRVLWKAW